MFTIRSHYDYLQDGYVSPDKGEDYTGQESLTDPTFYESFEELVGRILGGDSVPSRTPVWDRSEADSALWERGVDVTDFPQPSEEDIKVDLANRAKPANEAERKADGSDTPQSEEEEGKVNDSAKSAKADGGGAS